MKQRITNAHLQIQVDRINRLTESPMTPSYQDESGYHSNPLNYHLDWAYGGVCLERVCKDGHGTTKVIAGYGTKRELYEKMVCFIDGIKAKS